jgi:hypothetical protein
MKKIIALLLVICCFGMLFACNNDTPDTGDNDNNNNNTATVADFTAAIANTKPSLAIVTTKITTELGDLNAKFEISYNEDGSAAIVYSYEKFNSIEDGATNELKTKYEGTFTRNADGTYTGAEGVDISSVTAGTAIDLSKATGVTINEKGDVLTANVAKADTAAVLGSALSADAALKIAIDGGEVEIIEITYSNATIVIQYQ